MISRSASRRSASSFQDPDRFCLASATETVDCAGSRENGLCLFRRDAPIYATTLTDNGAMHRVPSNSTIVGTAYPDANAPDDPLLIWDKI